MWPVPCVKMKIICICWNKIKYVLKLICLFLLIYFNIVTRNFLIIHVALAIFLLKSTVLRA